MSSDAAKFVTNKTREGGMKNGMALTALLVGTWLQVMPLAAQPGMPQAAPEVPAPVLEADALAALKRVPAFLQTVNAFELRADVTTEEVYNSGQKLQFGQQLVYRMIRPDRMRLDFRSDLMTRRIVFNGRQTTVLDPQLGYFAQFDTVGTIGDLFDAAEANYGIELPLKDLLQWADPTFRMEAPASGFLVGPARIGTARTEHYAFRKLGIDFEIWILEGDVPLPLKIAITNTEDPAQPRYVALLSWNLAPTLGPDEFTFTPGPKDVRIPFQPRTAAAAATAVRK
jgi:hypothetical protein